MNRNTLGQLYVINANRNAELNPNCNAY